MSMPPGATLLDAVDRQHARYVVFPTVQARHAVTLWVAHTHALDAFVSTPRLAVLSPEKGSGKTRVLEVVRFETPNAKLVVTISPAALFRIVAEQQPVLLLDEADTYLGITTAKQHEDLKALVNAGHRRGATAMRAEVSGRNIGLAEFPAYAACALAGIGDLPDTILDRSIIVAMKRRAPHERIESFREREAEVEGNQLREQLAAWAEENLAALEAARPEMPPGITDRAADVWEPLLAVADVAGGAWPERARIAAVVMNNARLERDPSLGVQLLADCKRIFDEQENDRLTSETLVQALTTLPEAPWADLRGKPLDARGLANRLRKYDVKPHDHRFGDRTLRGYLREHFHDAWLRYLPAAHSQADVGDVGDVGDPQRNRETGGAVVAIGDRGVRGIPPISQKPPLSPPVEPQQAQQAQQTPHR